MGADRVLAIGVRYYRTPEESFALNRTARMETIRLADISGVLLNSLFLDALDSDLERMNRINQTAVADPGRNSTRASRKLRRIPVLAIRPSVDLAVLARDELQRFSWVLKHFLKGVGASDNHGADLLSYLAFESQYTTKLLKLGQADALAHKQQVLAWLEERP